MKEKANQTRRPSFKIYGVLGLLIIIISEILLFQGMRFVRIFFTPLAWTGYILFMDALIFKLRGHSLISNRTSEFIFMLPLSVICWLIFEAYNLHIKNWYYINLPSNMVVRILGYMWAFATIFPGILLTSEFIDTTGLFNRLRITPRKLTPNAYYTCIAIGLVFLVAPIPIPFQIAKYLIALVWVGFILFLDPINALLGGPSLFKNLETGKIDKLLSLFLAGLICGILWEFWNYWATTKWIYAVPYLQKPKIFEMPLAGFLGFMPFAVECYAMYTFAILIRKKIKTV